MPASDPSATTATSDSTAPTPITFPPACEAASLFDVRGIVAVITGGGTGIGLMMATALEHGGATVYIIGRRLSVLEAAAKEHSRHGQIIPLEGDITSRESLLAVAQVVRARHGFVNLLVNNAGVALGLVQRREHYGDIRVLQDILWESAASADYAQSFEVNVTGAYFCTVAFLDLLHRGNERAPHAGVTSQVITVSSAGAFRRDEHVYSIPYTLSKVASVHMGKLLTNILGEWKIRSNVIAPGVFPTEMIAGVVQLPHAANDSPLQRAGCADDIAGLILYLASRAGGFVDGTVHIVDGGRLSRFPSTY